MKKNTKKKIELHYLLSVNIPENLAREVCRRKFSENLSVNSLGVQDPVSGKDIEVVSISPRLSSEIVEFYKTAQKVFAAIEHQWSGAFDNKRKEKKQKKA